MFLAYRNGKRCYIDINGKIIIETVYAPDPYYLSDFHDEKAIVKIGNKFGFIDTKGKVVIEPKFNAATIFSEGLSGVKIGDKWGFINLSGEVVISPVYYEVGQFSCGLAGVEKEQNGKIMYINEEGKTIIQDSGNVTTTKFSEGMLSCYDDKTKMHGYRNTNGEWHIKPQYAIADDFSEGLAGVSKQDFGKTSFIDGNNIEIIAAQYESVVSAQTTPSSQAV